MKCEALAAAWVGDAEPARVEHESARLRFLTVRFGVDRVSKDGATKVKHVDANLVGSASVEITMNQRAVGGVVRS